MPEGELVEVQGLEGVRQQLPELPELSIAIHGVV